MRDGRHTIRRGFGSTIPYTSSSTSKPSPPYYSSLVTSYPRPSLLSLKRWNKANAQQLLMQKYDPDVIVPSIKPMCLSTNGLKHKLEPIENEGWYVLIHLHLSFIN